MNKPTKAGGEVDSYCTKCRLILGHRIIAMMGTKPVRVECQTCGSHHNYRPRMPGERPEPAARPDRPGAPRASRPPSRSIQAQLAREKEWEKSIAGKSPSDFIRYNVKTKFQPGDLMQHTKFGEGLVTAIVDTHKIEVLFRDQSRMLAHAMA